MANLTGNSTNDLVEGSQNLYLTKHRLRAFVSELTSDVLPEGSTNLYYTASRTAKAQHYFRQAGTSPLERWYGCGAEATGVGGTGSPAIDTLFALPYVSGRGGTIDRIAFNCTLAGGAGSVARCGIYTSTSDSNLYPDALVLDGGEFSCNPTAGVKSATVNVTLSPDKHYWFVYHCGVAAPQVRCGPANSMHAPLGYDNTLGTLAGTMLTVAKAYGALPGTFTGGGAIASAGPYPTVFVRYSA